MDWVATFCTLLENNTTTDNSLFFFTTKIGTIVASLSYASTLLVIFVSLYLIKRYFSANNLQFKGGMMLLHALIFTANVAFYIWSAIGFKDSVVIL